MRNILFLLLAFNLLPIALAIWLASLLPFHPDVARLWPAGLAFTAALQGFLFGRLVEMYVDKTTGGNANGGDHA
jgi:hypothetical protein